MEYRDTYTKLIDRSSPAVAREGSPNQTQKKREKTVQIILSRRERGSPDRDFPTVVDEFC